MSLKVANRVRWQEGQLHAGVLANVPDFEFSYATTLQWSRRFGHVSRRLED